MRTHLPRRLRSEQGNALWVSVLLMSTMVWVAYVSVQKSTTELKVAGNLRQGMLLRQAAEGALDRVAFLCSIRPDAFASANIVAAKTSVVGTPAVLLDCDGATSLCALHPALAGMGEYQTFSPVFGPFNDPHLRDRYSYKVTLNSHGPPQAIPLSEKFCMAKFDMVIEASAPGSAEKFQARSTIAAQPVACASY